MGMFRSRSKLGTCSKVFLSPATFYRSPTNSSPTFPARQLRLSTQIDWKETPNAHVVKADLRWLKKDDVKIEVEDSGKVSRSVGRETEIALK